MAIRLEIFDHPGVYAKVTRSLHIFFFICVEVLSSLLTQAEQTGIITGVPTSPKGPKISHLFFADDSILFCKSDSVEWRRLLKILGIYEAGRA